MSANIESVLIAALVGLAGWFVKDFLYGLMKRRDEIERIEWEYRLKEIYSPLYLWSGLLATSTDKQVLTQIFEHLHEVMAKAAYVIPRVHYDTLIRLLESTHGQGTGSVTQDERDKMRAYLYDHIEVFNLVLYRSEETGGVGDPSSIVSPYRRLLRLVLIALSQALVWLFVAIIIGGVLWLSLHRYFDLLGSTAVLLLLLVWVDTRKRADIQQGIAKRLGVES